MLKGAEQGPVTCSSLAELPDRPVFFTGTPIVSEFWAELGQEPGQEATNSVNKSSAATSLDGLCKMTK